MCSVLSLVSELCENLIHMDMRDHMDLSSIIIKHIKAAFLFPFFFF